MFISFLRTIILYLIIVITLRLMGKRQVGELEPAELVVAILISDLAAVPMQDIGIPLFSGVIPIITLLALELLSSEISMRSVRFRAFLCGKPAFIIRDGIIDQKAMKDNRLTLDELFFCLREQGILDISTIQYAILETNGTMTTFPYQKHSPMTPAIAGKAAKDIAYPVIVIDDGRLLEENLRAAGLDRSWLNLKLDSENTTPDGVFLMTATREGEYYLVKKEMPK